VPIFIAPPKSWIWRKFRKWGAEIIE